MSSPRLILKSQFSNSTSASFGTFINYMSRKEALINKVILTKEEKKELSMIENSITNYTSEIDKNELFNSFKEIDTYINYMGREQATKNKVSMFSNDSTNISKTKLEEIKDEVEQIENKQGNVLMYQDVFSFSKETLEELGIDKNNLSIHDNERIYESVKKSMNSLKENEKLNDLIWIGVPHINTDNLHIHVMSLEKKNSRKDFIYKKNNRYEFKGERNLKTVEKMKSAFGDSFFKELYLDNYKSIQKSRDLLIKKVLKDHYTYVQENKDVLKLTKKLLKTLPDNKNNWLYNGKHITDSQRILIDEIVENVTDKSPEKDKFLADLEKYEKQLENTYGDSNRYKDYKKNKLDEIKVRSGNSLLKNMKNNHAMYQDILTEKQIDEFFENLTYDPETKNKDIKTSDDKKKELEQKIEEIQEDIHFSESLEYKNQRRKEISKLRDEIVLLEGKDDIHKSKKERNNLSVFKEDETILDQFKKISKQDINEWQKSILNNKKDNRMTYVLNRNNPMNKQLYKYKRAVNPPNISTIGNRQIKELKKEIMTNYDVKEALKDYQKLQQAMQREQKTQQIKNEMEW